MFAGRRVKNIGFELWQIFRKTQLSHKHYLQFREHYRLLQKLFVGVQMQLTHGTRPVAAWEHQHFAAVLRLWRGAKHHRGHSLHWCQLQAVTGTGFNPLQSSSPCWCWPWWHGERGVCEWLTCAPSWGSAMLSISGEGRHLVAPMVPRAPLPSSGVSGMGIRCSGRPPSPAANRNERCNTQDSTESSW